MVADLTRVRHRQSSEGNRSQRPHLPQAGRSEPEKAGGAGRPASSVHQPCGARDKGRVGGGALETIAGVAGADGGAVPGGGSGSGWRPRAVLAQGQWTQLTRFFTSGCYPRSFVNEAEGGGRRKTAKKGDMGRESFISRVLRAQAISPGMSAISMIDCRGCQVAQSHPEEKAECRMQNAESRAKPPEATLKPKATSMRHQSLKAC